MGNKVISLLFIFYSLFFFIGCEHFLRRTNLSATEFSKEDAGTSKQLLYKRNVTDLENKLSTQQEKQLYSKLLPWFTNDEERIQYLNLPRFEDRQEWVQSTGILNRPNKVMQKFKRVIEAQDIAIGMPNEFVKKSWGPPLQIETSGNPLYKNEKWKYLRSLSSPEGFKQEKRTVYFEGGKVVGWETE